MTFNFEISGAYCISFAPIGHDCFLLVFFFFFFAFFFFLFCSFLCSSSSPLIGSESCFNISIVAILTLFKTGEPFSGD